MNIPKLLGWKDKDFQLGDGKQTAKFIVDKLKDGWIILMGDMETIEMIERVVYTPGTDKNKGFALVMGKILPDDKLVTNIFLAKKTDLFKERIMFWCNISEEVYDKLVLIDIKSSGDSGVVIWDYTVRTGSDDSDSNSNDLNKFYDDFTDHVVKNMLNME